MYEPFISCGVLTYNAMPLYMDIHRDLDASYEELEQAHQQDVEIQDEYDADFREFWMDEDEGVAFCLFEAPDKETGEKVHRESHGIVAEEIHEVQHGK